MTPDVHERTSEGVADWDATTVALTLAASRQEGKRVALCHGVFDLLHPGHLRHLARARQLADILVVSITADAFVAKGPGRPAFSEDLRAEALAALRVVDHVVITRDATALPTIAALEPDVYVKGSDYADEAADATGNIGRERSLVEQHRGTVVFTDEIVFSSSSLINQFLTTLPAASAEYVRSLRDRHGLAEVLSWLDRMSAVRVVVAGEAIIDAYTECEVLGKASKDPVLCLNRGSTVSYAGGSLAVAAHCHGLGARTSLVTSLNRVDDDHPAVTALKDRGIGFMRVDHHPRPTIRKERLVDERTGSRIVELYEMDDSQLDPPASEAFSAHLAAELAEADVAIVTDYGHGLLDDRALAILCKADVTLAVNVQANAGNRGLNSISRYPRSDFVTLNGFEARIELRQRHIDLTEAVPEILSRLKAQRGLVTLGAAGLDLYGLAGQVSHAPALTPVVKDRVGAGDAVLAATAILTHLRAPDEIVAFIGAVVGAWAVGFTGNQQTLDRGVLVRHVTSLLK